MVVAANGESAAGLRIVPLTDARAAEWDAFVLANPGGTFFHRAGWRNIFRDVFHLEPHFLIAERGASIVGVLPLVHQKSLLFGNAMIAAPFCVEGGPIATDDDALRALDQAAISLMHEKGAASLEFRSRKAMRPGWAARKDLYATFSRPLSESDDENLKAIPRKQRAVVRKTLQGPLVSEIDTEAGRLFRVYSESVRNLGTPVFPKRYFEALLKTFGKDCDIVTILDNGEPVSAVMNFYFRDTVLPYYGGGTAGARKNGANDFLYWETMRRAAARGYRRFDFGRSKAGTGAFAFKKNWGFEPEWLEYEFYLKPGTAMPEKNPNNPKFAPFIELWKRLPLPVANFIGPFLVRSLG
ncbi:MAG TPA: FemAB family XrtA/PEP-CTERM system-associated protein [Rhizomicrobium sp.]|nr:FemAB family XrtA/PEP-CTERM system-associated protein [Rhizomicrobium sp.]